jgi:hypothetical protein
VSTASCDTQESMSYWSRHARHYCTCLFHSLSPYVYIYIWTRDATSRLLDPIVHDSRHLLEQGKVASRERNKNFGKHQYKLDVARELRKASGHPQADTTQPRRADPVCKKAGQLNTSSNMSTMFSAWSLMIPWTIRASSIKISRAAPHSKLSLFRRLFQ